MLGFESAELALQARGVIGPLVYLFGKIALNALMHTIYSSGFQWEVGVREGDFCPLGDVGNVQSKFWVP